MSQDDIKQLRTNLSLDFTLGPSQAKKSKYDNCILETPEVFSKLSELTFSPLTKKMKFDNCILGTPDLAKIALSTPELDRLAFKAFQIATPVSVNFLRNEENDEKNKIANIWINNNSKPIKNEDISSDEYKFIPVNTSRIEDQLNQDPLEPIDMADQERIKLERKRYRNRIAASKCRQRKLERISKLQDRVSRLAAKNDELTNFMNTVQDIINRLNNHSMKHRESGCDIHDMQF